MFFCLGCVSEKPIASKVKFKYRVLCEGCADAARGVRKNGKSYGRQIEPEDDIDVIPQSILDAYAEARSQTD